MKFFVPPYTEENIKQQYRKFAKLFHPDKKGNGRLMRELNEEKDKVDKLVKLNLKKPIRSKFEKKIIFKKRPAQKMPRQINIVFDFKNAISLLKELRKW